MQPATGGGLVVAARVTLLRWALALVRLAALSTHSWDLNTRGGAVLVGIAGWTLVGSRGHTESSRERAQARILRILYSMCWVGIEV